MAVRITGLKAGDNDVAACRYCSEMAHLLWLCVGGLMEPFSNWLEQAAEL